MHDIIWSVAMLVAVVLAYGVGYARGRLVTTKFFMRYDSGWWRKPT